MTTLLVVLLAIAAALLVVAGLVLLATANRLDRLHVRMDAGWAALDNALARRAVVARAIAATVLAAEDAQRLRVATEHAETAGRAERESAENDLTQLLGGMDRAALPGRLAEELADAQHRIVIARRVHNDAVRDTLTLRRRRRVRYFRLAGTAAAPEYFEIVEPEPADAARSDPGSSHRDSVGHRVVPGVPPGEAGGAGGH